jgi:PKD repeat protein
VSTMSLRRPRAARSIVAVLATVLVTTLLWAGQVVQAPAAHAAYGYQGGPVFSGFDSNGNELNLEMIDVFGSDGRQIISGAVGTRSYTWLSGPDGIPANPALPNGQDVPYVPTDFFVAAGRFCEPEASAFPYTNAGPEYGGHGGPCWQTVFRQIGGAPGSFGSSLPMTATGLDGEPLVFQRWEVTGADLTGCWTGDVGEAIAGRVGYKALLSFEDGVAAPTNTWQGKAIYAPLSPDTSAPVVTIKAQHDCMIVEQDDVVPAEYTCTDPGGVDRAPSCVGPVPVGAPIDTSTVGTHTFSVTGTDASGNTRTNSIEYTVVPTNQPPLASAGDDQRVDEGDLVTLDGTASSDPDGDTLSYSWTLQPGYTGPGVTLSDPTAQQPTFTPTDNGQYTFTLTVDDGRGGSATDETVVTVDNLAPVITSFSSPLDPVPVGSVVNLSATFTDAGTNDTHTATFALDTQTQNGTVTETDGSGSATGAFTPTAAGVYTASVTITDDDGGTDTDVGTVPVVVYDPTAGFVTGGGRITSPAGAFTPDADQAGKATFGFVSRYHKGATIPSGNTAFVYHAAGLTFHSSDYDWLVISGPQAQYKGTGEVTGLGPAYDGTYKFILTAVDGARVGRGTPDTLRMKIFRDDVVLYDNGTGTPLDGGAIIIHK